MGVHSSNSYLSLSQMTDNAQYILDYLLNKGWTKNAICGMLGNMQRESTINPGIWQNLDEGNTSLGISLVQWTPATKYLNWCESNNLVWSEMDSALKRILYEVENNIQYIVTDSYPESFKEFTQSTKSVTYLASAFLHNYERAGVSAESERQQNAQYWYEHLTEKVNFTPMLDDSAIDDTLYWTHTSNGGYNQCIEIANGSVLPNCTGFAWGRFHMVSDLADGTQNYSNVPKLSRADAGKWFGYTQDGYERGQTAKLGAVICYSDNNGGAGHVGIVEEIFEDGSITISQSGYSSSKRFWTSKLSNTYAYSGYTFQGFIYNPDVKAGGGTTPSVPIKFKKRKGYNFILMNRRRRALTNGQRHIFK